MEWAMPETRFDWVLIGLSAVYLLVRHREIGP
jgi:hypothetical protein